ncbi:NADH-quinone oxidoreductase subunit NuoG [Acidiferrobacter sp.]|jgi:NADH-quinone oxidoreductase subunit G|uniref:NADH-quinone oxidoreductase subunit NuoG n=1 Tax=Acidiferrobacter sp. TaxID=1872107 RepID=UPI00262483A1|nr:NADH-quinone oxidoreductase subunit NuoG [Acidiferrobacter sp.]
MLHIEIDGKQLAVEEGAMIIEAADAAGIYIPRFCYHKKLSVAANCRMCLVDVERMAKPVPACATPVTEGMKVATRSEKTRTAQKGVMEFLLINHPLDCPICDQGGECDLQDLAVGYGRDVSRFSEAKRIIKDQDIGPLIATEMTRCIQCTRCVRFGQEIGGIMELGATGRGEHMRIGTYVEASVDSELSGNMIDLCPVGALTSKPFRYSARSWELVAKSSVSPHDCVGANLLVETRRNQVMRVLPQENEAVNETWISDRDRFSYTALDKSARLTVPLLRVDGQWRETDWDVALEAAAAGLREVVAANGAAALAALASPQATVEEGYLLARLMRGLGSDNVDHRLRESDVRDDDIAPAYPALGIEIAELERVDAVVLVGSNIRKDQPLLAHRLRKAFLDGARIAVINPMDFAFTFDPAAKTIVAPSGLPEALGRLVVAASACTGSPMPPDVAAWTEGLEVFGAERKTAEWLCVAERPLILLGTLAACHPEAAVLRSLAAALGDITGAPVGFLPPGNSAGLWLAGVVPQRAALGVRRPVPGRPASAMWDGSQKGFLLVDAEPVTDGADGGRARAALQAARFVVALSAFRSEALDYAHVLLPMAPFTETDGSFVNAAGYWQAFEAAVAPRGDARPGWKILRVLAEKCGVPDLAFDSSAAVRAAIGDLRAAVSRHEPMVLKGRAVRAPGFERIAEVGLYDSDSIVRHCEVLHKTADRGSPILGVNEGEALRLGLAGGIGVRVTMGEAQAVLEVVIDHRVPDGAAYIPAALKATALLPWSGPMRVSPL